MAKKKPKIKQIKSSLLTKDLNILNDATRELIEHASKNEVRPHEIYLCYLNVKKTWPGINIHKCFLSLCIENLKILGAEKNGYFSKVTKVQNYKIFDDKTLDSAIRQIRNQAQSKNIKIISSRSKTIRKPNPEDKEAALNEIIKKLNTESLSVYNANLKFSASTIEQWMIILQSVEKRLSARGSIEKSAEEQN